MKTITQPLPYLIPRALGVIADADMVGMFLDGFDDILDE